MGAGLHKSKAKTYCEHGILRKTGGGNRYGVWHCSQPVLTLELPLSDCIRIKCSVKNKWGTFNRKDQNVLK